MYTAAIICDKRKNKLHDKGLGSVKAKQDKTQNTQWHLSKEKKEKEKKKENN